MNFLKSHWKMLVLGLVCLASLGAGGWAYMGGAEITQKLESIDKLRGEVDRLKGKAANKDTIEAKEKDITERNAAFEKSMTAALAIQKYNSFYEKVDASGKRTKVLRDTLIPKVLPQPGSTSDAIDFKDAYRKAYAELITRLNAGGPPTTADVKEQEDILRQKKQVNTSEETSTGWGGGKGTASTKEPAANEDKQRTLTDVLNDNAQSRAAEFVARRLYMYIDKDAIGRHAIARIEEAPTATDIWHAQMSLWIQQDIVTALARCNEARAAKLVKEGLGDELWVARMPVKRLIKLSIADRLGNGGGSNQFQNWPVSFTGITNSEKIFVVPIRLELVIEQSALNSVLDSLCSVDFFTVTNVTYADTYGGNPLVNPIQENYIYGDEPVIRAVIDLEGYFIRAIFENWIPAPLKGVLKSADAGEGLMKNRPGGGG